MRIYLNMGIQMKAESKCCIKCGEKAIKNYDILSPERWNGKMFMTYHPLKGKKGFGRKGKIKTCKFVCNNCL